MMTYFHYKVKVRGQDLGYYLAKLLKRFQFSQNVFTFFIAIYKVMRYHIMILALPCYLT